MVNLVGLRIVDIDIDIDIVLVQVETIDLLTENCDSYCDGEYIDCFSKSISTCSCSCSCCSNTTSTSSDASFS